MEALHECFGQLMLRVQEQVEAQATLANVVQALGHRLENALNGLFHTKTSRSNSYHRQTPDPMELQSTRRTRFSARSPFPRRSPSPSPVRRTALTPEERQRCIKNGLCFRCRKPGHTVDKCPLSSNRPKASPKNL